MPRFLCCVMSALILAATSGCGPKTYPVHGKVLFPDGASPSSGVVEFRIQVPDGKWVNARSLIDNSGAYSLTTYQPQDGALPGEHAVVVNTMQIMTSGQIPLPGDPKSPPASTLVPRRYCNYETSGLSATVKPEDNTIDLHVDRQ